MDPQTGAYRLVLDDYDERSRGVINIWLTGSGQRRVSIFGGAGGTGPPAQVRRGAAHRLHGDVYEGLAANPATAEALTCLDILVDGPYIIEQDCPEMQYRGRRNQRPIALTATRCAGRIITLDWDRPEIIITHDGRILATGPLAGLIAGWGLGEAGPSRRCGQTN